MVEKKRNYVELYQRVRKQGAKALTAVLTLVLLLLVSQSAACLTWRFLERTAPPQVELSRVPQVGKQGVQADPGASPAALTDLHLFGRAGRGTVTALTDTSDLPATTLDFALVGVIFSSSPVNSVAIIGAKDADLGADLCGLGDKLLGAAVLSEIHPDRVILRRAGRYETLTIEKLTSPSNTIPSVKKATPPKRGFKQRDRRRHIRPRGDVTSWSVDRSYLNQRLANINSLASKGISSAPAIRVASLMCWDCRAASS